MRVEKRLPVVQNWDCLFVTTIKYAYASNEMAILIAIAHDLWTCLATVTRSYPSNTGSFHVMVTCDLKIGLSNQTPAKT